MHIFQRNEESFLFDPATVSGYYLDAAGEVAARLIATLGWDATGGTHSAAEDKAVLGALAELQTLHRSGHFDDSGLIPPSTDSRYPYQFSVVLSEHCNLNCAYCFASKSRIHHAPRNMPTDVMTATARFIAAHCAETGTHAFICTGLTSEPLLFLSKYTEFRALLAEEGRRVGLDLTARINASNLTTSEFPTLLHQAPDIEVLCVSVDGPPEVHDSIRVYPNGSGSYTDMLKNLDLLRHKGTRPPGAAAATLTGRNSDVGAVYRHLADLGFRSISVKPVRADPAEPFAIGHDLDGMRASYDAFVRSLLSLSDPDLLDLLLRFYSEYDYFGRFLIRVVERHRVLDRCPAWMARTTVDVDGKLYACDSLVGCQEAYMGTVYDGIDLSRVKAAAERMSVLHRVPCSTCWARFVCGGGCPYQSWLTHGSLDQPDPSECLLNQHLIELAIFFAERLRERHPAVIQRLPRINKRDLSQDALLFGYKIPLSWLHTRPWAGLSELPPTALLTIAAHLKHRISDDRSEDPCEVLVTVGGDSECFYILLTENPPASSGRSLAAATIDLSVPASLVYERDRLCSRIAECSLSITVDLQSGQARYGWSPLLAPEGTLLLGSELQADGNRYLLSLPWRSLHLRGIPETAFGLQVTLVDLRGGVWEWHPIGYGARIVLSEVQ